ncbi:hypothetical protein G7054_g8243 [Neopestalotiopsis clavispora]|nr:hypothetical protein G7054_g8243 [Neopestalotiopsis clavispora]
MDALKCSGDKNGCQRCRAVAATCVYETPERLHQDFPESSTTNGASILSSVNEVEVDHADRSQPRQQDDIRDSPPGAGVAAQSHSIPQPAIPADDFSWDLSPLESDLDWRIADEVMDLNANSSVGDEVPDQVSNHFSSKILHHLDTSLISPASMTPSSTGPKQSSKRFYHEPPNAGPDSSMEPQRLGASWDSVANLTSIWGSPMKYPLTTGASNHTLRSGLHDYQALPAASSNAPSQVSTTGPPWLSHSSNIRLNDRGKSRSIGGPCYCMPTMLNALENMGPQKLGESSPEEQPGLDDLLSSLAHGMEVIDQVLSCGQCNACADNGMLLATIAQQLGDTAASIPTCLSSQESPHKNFESTPWRRTNRRIETQATRTFSTERLHFGESVSNSSNNDDSIQDTSSMLQGTISVGRYKINSPEIQLQIMYHCFILHLSQLREILIRMKEKINTNQRARNILMDEEHKVQGLWEVFQTKFSR